MDLSVLVPTYDAEEKIIICLESILRQRTSFSYEIICLNDGSHISSAAFLEKAKQMFPRITFIDCQHKGISSTRNSLIMHAAGNYIMFVDADDILQEDAIEVLMTTALHYDADLVEGAYSVDGAVHALCDEENVFYRDDEKLYFSGFLWGKVIRRDLFDNIRFFEGHYYEDLIVHILLLPLAKICAYTAHVCYQYSRSKDGLSKTLRRSNDIMDSVHTLDHYLDLARQLSIPLGTYYKQFFRYYACVICRSRFQDHSSEQKKTLQEGLAQISFRYWDEDLIDPITKGLIDSSNIRPGFQLPPKADTLSHVPEEDCVTVVMCINDQYLAVLPVVIQSILNANSKSKYYDFIILHDHLNETRCYHTVSSLPSDLLSIRFIDIHPWVKDIRFGIGHHCSLDQTTYFRLFIPYILSWEYDKAIYLDCDTIIQTDLYDLFSIDIHDALLAAAPDITGLAEYYAPESRKKAYRDLAFSNIPPHHYFNAGLLLINLNAMRQSISFTRLIETIERTCWEQYDQDILNHLCADNVLLLSPDWNVIADFGANRYLPDDIRKQAALAEKSPKIIHYGGGSRKPWKKRNIPYFDVFWSIAKQTSAYGSLCEILQNNEKIR